MYVNTVTLVGNLTKDPERGKSQNGTIANMRIAVDKKWTDKEGNEQKNTRFIDVETFGVQADNCLDSLHVGDRVIMVGPLEYDEWETADGKRSKLKIKAVVVGKTLEFGERAA